MKSLSTKPIALVTLLVAVASALLTALACDRTSHLQQTIGRFQL